MLISAGGGSQWENTSWEPANGSPPGDKPLVLSLRLNGVEQSGADPGRKRLNTQRVMLGGDRVAIWELQLSDGVFTVEFEHGTTTGRRLVLVNGQEVVRRDWMFKLVGRESFPVGGAGTRATVHIEAAGGFSYEYWLEVGGRSLQRFLDQRAQSTRTWTLRMEGQDTRVVLEKDSMDVWCNGQKMETT
ncbi:LOW QUALITY PROTEIN: fas apoptotic inhibitory molecule 1-like [Menidia menidia]